MHILIIGLNHKSAPLNLREQLSFSSSTLCAFLNKIRQPYLTAETSPPIPTVLNETVILSTCNRMEYYAVTPNLEQAREEIITRLSRTFDIPDEAFRPHLYEWNDELAVDHLMRVAAGLDSMVLGEAQILGQVVSAYQIATAHHTVGRLFSRLFEMAIHTGKRVRNETAIGMNPASVSSVAVHLARQYLGNLSSKTVMILGAGNMGLLTIKAVLKFGVGKMLIVNRTRANADKLAAQWNATAMTFEQLEAGLQQADLIVASTGAPHTVLHRAQVAKIMATRPQKPLLIIDIAVPRDVDDEVDAIPGVHLFNLDHLQTQVEDNLNARRQEIPYVERIIAEEKISFLNWLHSLDVIPTLTQFRKQFEAIRQQELARTLHRLSDLDKHEQELVVELSHRLLNKFLHRPTVRLRKEAAHGNGIMYTTALQELFDLEVNLS